MPYPYPDDENQLTPEIILGARQLRNPEGIAPRMDTEGPPPTRMPKGAKLEPIPTHSDAKMNIDNVDPVHAMEQPGMVREASAHNAPPEDNMVMNDAGAQPAPDTSALPASSHTAPQTAQGKPGLAPLDQSGLAGHALAQEGQARHAAKLREFGDAEAHLNAGLLKSPDEFNNPTDYTKYLTAITAGRGALKQAKAEYELSHPWGAMESAHPGVFGKIGHAFGQIGNVAGEAFAPGLAEAIPGSHANLEGQVAEGEAGVKQAIGEQGAIAGGEQKTAAAEKAGEQAQTEESKRQKNVAEAGRADAQTNVINAVGGKKLEKLSDNSVIEVSPDGSVKKVYQGDPKVKTSFQTLEIDGKPHRILADANTGQMIHDLGEAPQSTGADKGITMIVPNAQGSGDVVRVAPGTKNIPMGAQTPSGFADLGRPTQQQRNAAGRATNAVEKIPGIISEINTLEPKLGAISGRWNDFMQGKVGLEDADFAGLHQDLMMLSSAVALAHAVGRLPENLRLEFDHAINAPKQDPKNLVAVLHKVDDWMQSMRNQGTDPFTKAAETSGNKPIPGGTAGGGARPSVADWLKSRKGPK